MFLMLELIPSRLWVLFVYLPFSRKSYPDTFGDLCSRAARG